MFNRRLPSWMPLSGGDLGTSAPHLGNDDYGPEDGYRPPLPPRKAIARTSYEMSTMSRPPASPPRPEYDIEGDEASLLSARRHKAYPRLRRIRRKFSGWRMGLMMSSGGTGAVLFLNLTLTIWAIQTFGTADGSGTLFEGDCTKTRKASTWIHLAINVLSTLLIGASNYCMQILTAPTRTEVNRAHASFKWLDIGVLSIRNLRWILRRRVWLWGCLALSSLPLHLLYNSAVYESLTANEYDLYTGVEPISAWTPSALENIAPDVANSLMTLAQLARTNQLDRLDPTACIQTYGRNFVSDHSDLVLIVSNQSSLIQYRESELPLSTPYNWICSAPEFRPEHDRTPCDLNPVLANLDRWTYSTTTIIYTNSSNGSSLSNAPIRYCLSQKVEEHCQLQFSVSIMAFVIIANFLKICCMVYTLWSLRTPTLVTLGDAISSFLQEPDSTTVGRCTLSGKNVDKDEVWYKRVYDDRTLRLAGFESFPSRPEPWQEQSYHWFKAASRARWGISYTCCIITLIAAGILLGFGIASIANRGSPIDLKSLWNMGFGAVNALSLIEFGGQGQTTNNLGLVGNVLLANVPQVILSFLYFSYKGIFTCQLISSEWTSYTVNRKALRVTSPIGIQRSTYFLQLPYTYSLPLMIFSGILHWLVSQSIFLARVNVYSKNHKLSASQAVSTCGYSCIALVFVLIVGSILLLAGFANGYRRYPSGIPLAGTCSVAISAACHPPADDVDAAFKEVQYGEVETRSGGARHCTFTSCPVTAPVVKALYT